MKKAHSNSEKITAQKKPAKTGVASCGRSLTTPLAPPARLSQLLEKIENYVLGNDDWSLATAGRTHGDIIQVGNWAKKNGYLNRNPFAGLTRFECVNEDNE